MKNNIIYIVFVILLFLLMYWSNQEAPIEYQWQPTYSTRDKQPFGSYAFDKILTASLEYGYEHNYYSLEDLYSYLYNDTDEDFESDSFSYPINYNLLITAYNLIMEEKAVEILLEYVEKGGSVLLAAEHFPKKLCDTLNISTSAFHFAPEDYLPNIYREDPVSEIRLFNPDAEKTFSFPRKLIYRYFEANDTVKPFVYLDSTFIISENEQHKIISLRYQIGKGNLILVSNPRTFTNYGMLNDSINTYIQHHLAYLKNRPLVRTEYYEAGSQGEKDRSEFRVILNERSLKWAFYILLTGIFVLMFFTAKRKQKSIPILKPPANKILDFVRSIAGLYIQKNNNADIILKKQIYWSEALKQKYGIDSINETQDYDFYLRVASKTGQPVDEIRRLWISLRAIDEDTFVSDEEMMKLITKMNKI
ncbi:hypothetical protein FACS189426_01130 [Bacteroidia bacterium]|nr:hypothetical protein FACS189426_01130 [Bacteroidia bacterium]